MPKVSPRTSSPQPNPVENPCSPSMTPPGPALLTVNGV
jgi:hypothetical protein